MFKKIVMLIGIMLVSAPIMAVAPATTNWPWLIQSSGTVWPIANTSGKRISVTFTVNPYVTGNIMSDPVTLACNKPQVVNPGATVTCTLAASSHAEFQIAPQHFKNGSSGAYTVS